MHHFHQLMHLGNNLCQVHICANKINTFKLFTRLFPCGCSVRASTWFTGSLPPCVDAERLRQAADGQTATERGGASVVESRRSSEGRWDGWNQADSMHVKEKSRISQRIKGHFNPLIKVYLNFTHYIFFKLIYCCPCVPGRLQMTDLTFLFPYFLR